MESKHPEGLTMEQERLADLLITTKTRAKIRKRRLLNGRYYFYEVERDINLFAFAQDENEFVFKLHENNPAAPLSPDKINLRNLPENVLDLIGKLLAKVPIKEKPEFCTGIPDAGVPLAKAYSRYSNIPYIDTLTKVETKRGRRVVSIKTGVTKDTKLLIVDDVLTKAFFF